MEDEILNAEDIAGQIVDGSQELKALVGKKNPADVSTLLPLAIKAVEAKSQMMGMSSEGKKEVAVAIISKLVKMPSIPDELKPLVIGKLVDAAVAVANKFLGKKWFQKTA